MVAPHAAPSYQHPPGNGLAVAGLVLGILGLALCWLPFVGWLCALVGIILGALGMSRAKKIGGRGKGMAVAGLICGIIGLFIGIMLFVLATMAVKSFDDYMTKSKRSEATLQLRSIETKVKTFRIEKGRFPISAPELPGKIATVCGNGNMMFPRIPQSQWGEGWAEMGFHIDEDSRCSYEYVSSGQSAKAIARCDLDCNGSVSETTLSFTVVEGNTVANYSDPTPE